MGRGENTFSLRDSVFTPAAITDPVQEILGPIWLDPCSHPNSIVPALVRYYLPEYAPGFSMNTPIVMPATPKTLTHRTKEKRNGVEVEVEHHVPIVVPAHVAVVGDGLVLPWGPGGLVFVNPPYSNLSEEPWFLRALRGAELEHAMSLFEKGGRKRLTPTPSFGEEFVWFVPVRTAGSWWQLDVVQTATMITFLNFRVQHVNEPHPSPFHQCLIYRGPRGRLWKERATKLFGWTVAPDEVSF